MTKRKPRYCPFCRERLVSKHRCHCKKGHALTPDNIVITREGWQRCLTCNRTYHRLWQRAKRSGNADWHPSFTGGIA